MSPACAEGLDFRPLKLVPIQEGGRVKPLDTFSRESVRLVTGRETFEGKAAMEILLDWLARPGDWNGKNFILVQNPDLRDFLKMPAGQKFAAPLSLVHDGKFMDLAKAALTQWRGKTPLSPMGKETLAVYGRLQRYEDIVSGDALALLPVVDPKTGGWASLGDIQRSYRLSPKKMPEALHEVLSDFLGVLKSYAGHDPAGFTAQSEALSMILRLMGGKDYADPGRMALEVRFNTLKPFLWAWIIHLLAAALVGLSFLSANPRVSGLFYRPGMAFFMAGIAVSLYGFILRCLIAGRPPVSNMYESLIWATFGMTVFALVFEALFKVRYFVLAGSILAVAGYVLADNVPTVLDPSLQPIEPVLRSNFWLTIHVLTITLSYAAFLLSLGIGHVCYWFLWFRGNDKERARRMAHLLYRVVQVGVVLLAAGTILGGVWASYSWGRFWGWDPKETWALIALLGYVAVLHGRLAGWLREKGFVIGVVLAFLGVLMAWYGVNFILGVGLHSYGFSKGGLPYVASFVALELALTAAVALRRPGGADGPVPAVETPH